MITKPRVAGVAALMALAVAFTGGWEGLRLTAYRDTGGVPTICSGATLGVIMGQTATAAECAARLATDLALHEMAMRACLQNPSALSDKTYRALLDFTFNVGARAACASTLFRLVNAGQVRVACDQFSRWIYDNGRVVQGLVNRRASERALCIAGLE